MNSFTFDGENSKDYSLIVNRKNVPLTPPIDNRLQEISGFDGAWDYGVSYSPREIEVDCTILADSKDDLKMKLRRLAGLLNPRKGAKPLIFNDDPSVFYSARLGNQIPLEQLGAYGTFTLLFVCPDPFTYEVDVRTGSFMNDILIDQKGTYISKPVLQITHAGGTGSITNTRDGEVVETLTFTEDSPSGIYYIDCRRFTVMRNREPAYNYVKGDFISLDSGENFLVNHGNIERTTIEFRNTWL